MSHPRVVEAEYDDARAGATGGRRDFSEIEVERQYDTILGDSLLEDFAVRKSL